MSRSSYALDAKLTSSLPDVIEVGAGLSFYLEGRCDPAAEPGSLRIRIGDWEFPVEADGIGDDGQLAAGDRWWTLADLPAAAGAGTGEVQVALAAAVGGEQRRVGLGTTRLCRRDSELAPPAPSAPAAAEHPLIAICMATYEPDPDRLAVQIESIKAQDWPNWICLVSDDASSPESYAALRDLVGDDPRFLLSRADQNLGFYRNFDRVMRMAPVEARYLALADQDDHWYPDKLSRLEALMRRNPAASLGYSDMRVIHANGQVHNSIWFLRRNNFTDAGSMMVANTVTGAASLIRADLIRRALPLPLATGQPYHDHWLALCALLEGGIAYLDEPTYDRIIHPTSVTSMARGNPWVTMPQPLGIRLLRAVAQRLRRAFRTRRVQLGWRGVYFGRYIHLRQFCRSLALRYPERWDQPVARRLRTIEGAERSPTALAWLAARSLRHLFGANETMGRERLILGAVLWRRAAVAAAHRERRRLSGPR